MTVVAAILLVTLIVGIYMAWNIGANDVANAMGTSVGSGALTLKQAIVLAAIFEFLGAVLVGMHVTDTIRGRIVDITLFEVGGPLGADGPLILALGMLSALLAAGIWLNVATYYSLPVSTTHAVVGAVLGFGVVSFGLQGIHWAMIGQIVLSWFVSPVLGGILAYLSFAFIRRQILKAPDPARQTRLLAPYMVSVVIGLLVLSFIFKVLGNVLDEPPVILAVAIALAAGGLGGWSTGLLVRRFPPTPDGNPYAYVERVFAILQVVTACYVAFAHGANDVANAVGPVASVVTLAGTGFMEITVNVPVPIWILMLGGAGIVVGLATYGYRVIATVGKKITEMTPTRGFSAEFGAANTVLLASWLGLPVSTTHTLVGAVIGVGAAQGMAALNLRVIRNIVNSWVATLPTAAVISAGIFVVLRHFLV